MSAPPVAVPHANGVYRYTGVLRDLDPRARLAYVQRGAAHGMPDMGRREEVPLECVAAASPVPARDTRPAAQVPDDTGTAYGVRVFASAALAEAAAARWRDYPALRNGNGPLVWPRGVDAPGYRLP